MKVNRLLLFSILFVICGGIISLAIVSLYNVRDAKAKVEFPTVVKVGKTLDANVVPSSYNENIKTQIRTEHASIVIEGARSILLGRESFVKTTEDGKEKMFCVENECYRMY